MKGCIGRSLLVLLVFSVVFGLVGLNLYQAGRVSMMKEMVREGQDRERDLLASLTIRVVRAEGAAQAAVDLSQQAESTLIAGERWLRQLVSTPWRWYRRFGKKLKTEWAGLPPSPGVGMGGPEGDDDARTDETDFATGFGRGGGAAAL